MIDLVVFWRFRLLVCCCRLVGGILCSMVCCCRVGVIWLSELSGFGVWFGVGVFWVFWCFRRFGVFGGYVDELVLVL